MRGGSYNVEDSGNKSRSLLQEFRTVTKSVGRALGGLSQNSGLH